MSLKECIIVCMLPRQGVQNCEELCRPAATAASSESHILPSCRAEAPGAAALAETEDVYMDVDTAMDTIV